MSRTAPALGAAIPASPPARGVFAGPSARAAGPRGGSRRSRIARLAIALAACAAVGFVGWIFLRGTPDLELRAAMPSVGAPVCDGSSCPGRFAPASQVLPAEWRWEPRKPELGHMVRQ